ncbi:hypothetical protein TNCV_3521261 [Trichonephila clavipes]|nr:hypothetical protein TNCV_3521261 [Trichonephila clavipes]
MKIVIEYWVANVEGQGYPKATTIELYTSNYTAASGLLVAYLVILTHSQVTRPTPDPPPNFHTSPTGERLSLDIFNMHQPICTADLQRYQALPHDIRVRGLEH